MFLTWWTSSLFAKSKRFSCSLSYSVAFMYLEIFDWVTGSPFIRKISSPFIVRDVHIRKVISEHGENRPLIHGTDLPICGGTDHMSLLFSAGKNDFKTFAEAINWDLSVHEFCFRKVAVNAPVLCHISEQKTGKCFCNFPSNNETIIVWYLTL